MEQQPESPRINPAFIQFREKLNKMEKAGEFLEPIGPLVYAIQERQANEVRVQVQRHNLAFAPRELEVFSRPDLLSPDDFRFFLKSLKPAQFWQMLTGLSYESASWLNEDGAWLQPAPKGVGDPLFLKQFIREYVHHLDVEVVEGEIEAVRTDHLENGFMTAKLYNLVAAVFEPGETQVIYKRLEGVLSTDKVKANRFGIELKILDRVPMAIDAVEGEPAYLGFKMHPGNDSPAVKAWLQRYELFKSIDQGMEDHLPSRIKNRFVHYSDSLPKERKGYHVPVIRRVLDTALHECAEHLIQTLSQKSSVALQCFGVPSQKSSAGDIPRVMREFANTVKDSALRPEVQQRLLGQMFITLLNGRGKEMRSDAVKNVLGVLKEDIDWEYCVSKLNAKGRAQMISEFDDSNYFNKYLGNKDLGTSFSKDLGL